MPKPSIGASASGDCHQLILIEAAAGEDRDIGEVALIENAPHALRECNHIAAIETHAAGSDAGSFEPRGKRHDLSGSGLGVIGIDQKDQAFRPRVSKSLEGNGLVIMGLDVGMRHRAEERNTEESCRQAPWRCRQSPAM